jgi:hypothetical protein
MNLIEEVRQSRDNTGRQTRCIYVHLPCFKPIIWFFVLTLDTIESTNSEDHFVDHFTTEVTAGFIHTRNLSPCFGSRIKLWPLCKKETLWILLWRIYEYNNGKWCRRRRYFRTAFPQWASTGWLLSLIPLMNSCGPHSWIHQWRRSYRSEQLH